MIPNRHGASTAYRYGFNGKEKDDEIKGEGIQYDYGFRVYDSRLGKFLSKDPLSKEYPWYTPYQFAGNKPIVADDLDGLEERIVIMNTTAEGKIRRETLDFKTLQKTTEYVGVKHSQRFSPITKKEFNDVKKQMWDAFSNTPDLFSSGYKSYTIGMNDKRYKNSGFTGMYKGTLTVASGNSGINIVYDPRTILTKKLPSTIDILREAPNNPEMARGINTAKNYVNGISLVVSGPSLLAGKAKALDYVGALYDIDQVTGTSENLLKDHPDAQRVISIIEVGVDFMSLKSAPGEVIDMMKTVDKCEDVSTTIPTTIIGAADTVGDVNSATKKDEPKQ